MRNARLMVGPTLAIIALSLTGCVTTNGTAINPAHSRAPVPVATVVLYETADTGPGKYEETALLDTRSDSVWRSQAATLGSIREAAAGTSRSRAT